MSLCTIVGIGPGIGLSIAKKFANEGFDIAMISRNKNHLQDYVKELSKYKTNLFYDLADVGNEYQLTKALKKFVNETNVLVYNAAVVEKSSFFELDAVKLLSDLKINIVGALITAQQIIPSMKKRGNGTIIFNGGGFSYEPDPRYVSLSIGKASLLNLAINLANYYKPNNIHVAVINIYGKVEKGTKYDPELIAKEYWKIYKQPKNKWKNEIQIK